MDEQAKLQYESQATALRADLKKWEGDWVRQHGGQKPSRDDIKGMPEIARKYKEYHRLRDTLAGKPKPNKAALEEGTPSRKRKAGRAAETKSVQTPSKRPRTRGTPLKSPGGAAVAVADGTTTPSLSRKLFSPAAPTSIGPTPQRDGRVLGLFDLLASKDAPTPSRSVAVHVAVNVGATPRKRSDSATEREGGVPASARTPRSSSRHAHASLTTPSHRRAGIAKSPRSRSGSGSGLGSISKLQFATPAFLRRVALPMPTVDENAAVSPAPRRLPRKPLFKSLSSVVAGLRKLEEETLDDELDVLREMENEEQRPVSIPAAAGAAGAGGSVTNPAMALSKNASQEKTQPPLPALAGAGSASATIVEVRDSQALLMPDHDSGPGLLGAFDDEDAYDSPEEVQLDRGRPLRVFQKRKPKRTTRRANMRPTRARRPAAVEEGADGEGGDEDGDDGDVVPETQHDAAKQLPLADEGLDLARSASDGDGEFGPGDEDMVDDAEEEEKAKKEEAKKKAKKGQQKDGKGPVQRAVRMVKATANANYKRLKLKKKQGGNARFGGRFGRRR